MQRREAVKMSKILISIGFSKIFEHAQKSLDNFATAICSSGCGGDF